MFLKQKYIKTDQDKIIVFSELFQHTEFSKFNPKSAGFIAMKGIDDGWIECTCYGESISLGLKSHPEDTDLANRQLFNLHMK